MIVITDIEDEDLQSEFERFGMKIADQATRDEMKLLCIALQKGVEDLCDEWMAVMAGDMAKSKTQQKVITCEHVKAFDAAFNRKMATPASKTSTPLTKTPGYKNQAFRTPDPVRGSANRPFSSVAKNWQSGGALDNPSLLNGSINFSESPLRSARKPDNVLKFSERTNRFDLVAGLGKLPDNMEWDKLPNAPMRLKVTAKDPATCLIEPYPCMFVKHADVAQALNAAIDEMGDEIALAHDEIMEYSSPTLISAETTTLGRLLPGLDGKLNAGDLSLQSSSTFHNGVVAKLDVSQVSHCSFFPGQVIGCTGRNNGLSFVANKIFQGEPPKSVKVTLGPSESLHVVVACGPYSTLGAPHNQAPEPLQELLRYVKTAKPDLVFLLGPFVDPKLAQDEEWLSDESIEDYFKLMTSLIINEIIVEMPNIHVVFVPSAGQLIGLPIYPVPPFSLQDCVKNAGLFTVPEFAGRIVFVPEPALLNVNGVVIGVTSTDIIAHLSARELSDIDNVKGERVSRLAGHLLQQQSFYPLYPTEVPADVAALHKYAKIRVRPHVLITPSVLSGFIKMVHGTVCINPERLTRGYAGGSFARFFIPTATPEDGAEEQVSLAGRIAAQVLKI